MLVFLQTSLAAPRKLCALGKCECCGALDMAMTSALRLYRTTETHAYTDLCIINVGFKIFYTVPEISTNRGAYVILQRIRRPNT